MTTATAHVRRQLRLAPNPATHSPNTHPLCAEMAGGAWLYEKIAAGINVSAVFMAFVSAEYVASDNCNKEFNRELRARLLAREAVARLAPSTLTARTPLAHPRAVVAVDWKKCLVPVNLIEGRWPPVCGLAPSLAGKLYIDGKAAITDAILDAFLAEHGLPIPDRVPTLIIRTPEPVTVLRPPTFPKLETIEEKSRTLNGREELASDLSALKSLVELAHSKDVKGNATVAARVAKVTQLVASSVAGQAALVKARAAHAIVALAEAEKVLGDPEATQYVGKCL